jgi:uncharacterized protein YjiS (DUF1127 family)
VIAASHLQAVQPRSAIGGQTFMARAFRLWRERRHARAALSGMTARDLADIGLTASDRTMALAMRDWNDPDSGRNISTYGHRRLRTE